jgi:dipeptidyl aminopeptidase/acylaminoacyl peptidase
MRSAAGVALATVALLVGRIGAQPLAPPETTQPPPDPHPFGVRDLWAIERVSDPQPSPDGRWVAFVRTSYDVQANKGRSNLWLVPAGGGEARALTTTKSKDTSPRWAPDGKSLAFLSDRGGLSQIWSLDLQGGEPHVLVDVPVDVSSFAISPSGVAIVFVADVYPDCETLQCTADRAKKIEKDGTTPRRYTHLLYRHLDEWDSGRRNHIFVVPAGGGAAVDILRGADLDAPPRPGGGPEAWAWSPDGSRIAVQGRLATAQASWTTNLDLYLCAADGSGYRCITESNLAADAAPAWSPDGHTLAYLAMSRPGFEADRQRIVLYDVAKHSRRTLTDAWDRSPSEIVWSASGKKLYASVPDEAKRQIYAVDAGSGKAQKIAPQSSAAASSQAAVSTPGSAVSLRVMQARGAGERLVFLHESLVAPADVWSCAADGKDVVRLTSVNDDLLSRAHRSQPQEIWFDGAGGARVHAWMFPPVDRQEGNRYPLLLLVHGGPQGSWDDRFSYRWNPQIFAGAGYAVLAPDPHGSVGYGQSFTDAIREDWGGKPYEDLMRAVDHTLATVAWVDSNRVAAAGASYGGYMMNWIEGHTNRFRALVCHAGLFDMSAFYWGTEEHWFPEWEMGGTPWDSADLYAKWTPSAFVKNWKTPMLVTHGGKDYRVPETQGFGAFATLQRLGIPSEFVYFPDESHGIQKPRNGVLWYDTVLAWLDRWLKAPAPRG